MYKAESQQSKAEAVYNEVKRLQQSGSISTLVKAGLMSPKTITYLEIAECVQDKKAKYKRTSNKVIVSRVATQFRVSPATVYRAICVMRRPLQSPATKRF